MTLFTTKVLELLDKGEKQLVFPNVEVLNYYKKEYSKLYKKDNTKLNAVTYDYVLEYWLKSINKKPINDIMRYLYASKVSKIDGIKAFANKYNSNYTKHMQKFIVESLPKLNNVDLFTDNFRDELPLLLNDYISFLEKNSLVETKAEILDTFNFDKDYVLIEPKLNASITPNFLDSIVASGRISLLENNTIDNNISLYEADNSKAEIKGIMQKIVALNNNKIPFKDIIISCPNITQLKPLITSQAKLFNVPLTYCDANKHCKTGLVQLLKSLNKLYNSSFALGNIEDLLLMSSYKWGDIEFNREFVRSLISKNLKRGDIENDLDSIVKTYESSQDLKAQQFCKFYKGFRNCVITINEADSITTIINTVDKFIASFLLEAPNGYDTVIALLKNWASLQETIGIKNNLCFDAILSVLDDKTDNMQLLDTETVKVYTFGTDAVVESPFRFVVGLSVDANVTFESCNVDDIINRYSTLSETLVCTYAKDSYAGFTLPIERFVRSVAIKPFSALLSQEEALIKTTFLNTENVKETKAKDWCDKTSGGPVLNKTRQSFSSINTYMNCPYAYFLSYGLNLDNDDFISGELNHSLIGQKLHEVAELFLDEHKMLPSYNIELLINDMKNTFDKVMNDWQKDTNAPDTFTSCWMRNYKEKFVQFLGNTLSTFAGAVVEEIEEEIICNDNSFEFYGRIDCVLRLPNGNFVLVDFKKGDTKDKVNSIQLPLYKKFYQMKHSSRNVEVLAYYSFKEDKYRLVTEEEKLSKDAEDAINTVIRGSENGDYHANVNDKSCANCKFCAICRKRFNQ